MTLTVKELENLTPDRNGERLNRPLKNPANSMQMV